MHIPAEAGNADYPWGPVLSRATESRIQGHQLASMGHLADA